MKPKNPVVVEYERLFTQYQESGAWGTFKDTASNRKGLW